ncbi:MAG: hypothetical protein U0236_04915 [Nitrospira sp.]
MRRFRSCVLLCAVSLLALALTACGGGDGDGGGGPGPGNSGLLIQGGTWAPNGSLAKAVPQGFFQRWFAWLLADEAYAQAARLPLANTRLVVFRINKDGSVQTSSQNPTGVVTESKTDGGGRYSFFLPVGVSYSSDLIIQASDTAAGAAPIPIGQARSLNAPVTGPGVNINPFTETAVRELIAHAQPLAGSLPDIYANQETSSFVATLEGLINAPGTTLQEAIDNIRTRDASLIAAGLDVLDEPGQVDQSTITGSYAVAGYFFDADNSGVIKRYTHVGNATFDGGAGRFQFSLQQKGAQTTESCSAACTRAFSRNPYSTGPFSVGGTFLYYPTRHELFLTADNGQLELLKVNTTENVMMFPQGWTSPNAFLPNGFTIAIRKGSGVTAGDLGPGVNIFGLEASLSPSASPTAGTWGGPLEALIVNGSLTFAPPNVMVTGNGTHMTQRVSCTVTATGCTVTATVALTIESLNAPDLPFTITPDGTLTVNPGPDALQGSVDRSKTILMFPGDTDDGASITFGTSQTGSLTAASLNGTYFAILMREKMDQSGRITSAQHGGTMTLSNGTFSFADAGQLTGGPSLIERQETCPSTATCAIKIAASGNIQATFTGTYSMEPGARLRLKFATEFGEYIAAAAPDTSFIHGAAIQHGVFIPNQPIFSERALIMMLKQ